MYIYDCGSEFCTIFVESTDDNTEYVVDSIVVQLSFGVDVAELALNLVVIDRVFVCRIECDPIFSLT